MNPLTREWVEKAEADLLTAQRESRARKAPNYDAACFHAQQCAEKYMKARLHAAGTPFGKTHNLVELLDSLVTIEPLWESLRLNLKKLSEFAVAVRYPGESADKAAAQRAIAIGTEVRQSVRKSLRLRNDKR